MQSSRDLWPALQMQLKICTQLLLFLQVQHASAGARALCQHLQQNRAQTIRSPLAM